MPHKLGHSVKLAQIRQPNRFGKSLIQRIYYIYIIYYSALVPVLDFILDMIIEGLFVRYLITHAWFHVFYGLNNKLHGYLGVLICDQCLYILFSPFFNE